MRIVTEEERLWKIIRPWMLKGPDPDLKNSPEEIQKLLRELRRVSRETRMKNG